MKSDGAVAKDIDAYIAQYPAKVRAMLTLLRTTVRKAAPGATEAIKYGMPTFVGNASLVHFAVFKNHIGFYPAPRTVPAFKKDLAEYGGAKSSVSFPLDEPIPVDLVTRIVKHRLAADKVKTSARSR